jgi:hypothetical protein
MVLEHYDDRPLVDGEKSICVHFGSRRNVDEQLTPGASRAVSEVPQHGHDFDGRIRRLASAAVGLIVPLSLSGACAEYPQGSSLAVSPQQDSP